MKQRVEEKDLCKYSKSNKEMKRKVRMGRRGSRLVGGKAIYHFPLLNYTPCIQSNARIISTIRN